MFENFDLIETAKGFQSTMWESGYKLTDNESIALVMIGFRAAIDGCESACNSFDEYFNKEWFTNLIGNDINSLVPFERR